MANITGASRLSIDPSPKAAQPSESGAHPLFQEQLSRVEEAASRLSAFQARRRTLSDSVVDFGARKVNLSGREFSLREVPDEYRKRRDALSQMAEGMEKWSLVDQLEEEFCRPLLLIQDVCTRNIETANQLEEFDRAILGLKKELRRHIEDYRTLTKEQFVTLSSAEKRFVSGRAKELNRKLAAVTQERLFHPAAVIERGFRSHHLRKTVQDLIFIRKQTNGSGSTDAKISAALKRKNFSLLKQLIQTPEDQKNALIHAIAQKNSDFALRIIKMGPLSEESWEISTFLAVAEQNGELLHALIRSPEEAGWAFEMATHHALPQLQWLMQQIQYPIPLALVRSAIEAAVSKQELAIAEALAVTTELRGLAALAAYKSGGFAANGLIRRMVEKGIPVSEWRSLFQNGLAENDYAFLDCLLPTLKLRKAAAEQALLSNRPDCALELMKDLHPETRAGFIFSLLTQHGVSVASQMIRSPEDLSLTLNAAASQGDVPSLVRLMNVMPLPFPLRREAILTLIQKGNFLGLIAVLNLQSELGFAVEAAAKTNPSLLPKLLQQGEIPQPQRKRAIQICVSRMECGANLQALLASEADRSFAAQTASDQNNAALLTQILQMGTIQEQTRDALIQKYALLGKLPILELLVDSPATRGIALRAAAKFGNDAVFKELSTWGELLISDLKVLVKEAILSKKPEYLRAIAANPAFQGFEFDNVANAIKAGLLDELLDLNALSENVRKDSIRWAVAFRPDALEQLIQNPEDRGLAVESAAFLKKRQLMNELLKKGAVPHGYLLRAQTRLAG